MRVALGITGSIAAYKAAELVRLFKGRGHEVRVVMTRHAAEFITPLTLQTLSQNPVTVEQFAPVTNWEIGHIETARWADVVVVAPATANAITKFAAGVADDALSTLLLATKSSIAIAPAMNPVMWHNTLTQNAVVRLSDAGVVFVGPDSGATACGEEGWGRLTELEKILNAVESLKPAEQDLKGLKLLVTAGPTREPLDPIRFLSNSSTGRQGYAIAAAAHARGAEVLLVTGPTNRPAPLGIETISVTSAAQMAEAVFARSDQMDAVVMTAAVADYTPVYVSSSKIKKSDGEFILELKRTEDILARLGSQKPQGQILVGFAAETENLEENARTKLESKNCDAVVANTVADGFGGAGNSVLILEKDGTSRAHQGDKRLVAEAVLDVIVRQRA